MLAEKLTGYGYEVALEDYGTGTNVVGRKPGTSATERTVVIGAHYDHIPDCPGADDNATGVAATLEIARLIAQVDLEHSVAIAFWDEEELGLIGSQAFVTDLVAAEEDVVINFTFDTIGFRSDEPDTQTVPNGFSGVFPDVYDRVEANGFRGDFVAIITNAAAHDPALAVAGGADRIGLLSEILEIPAGLENAAAFNDLRRSDHAAFWAASYPAVFLTDTANFRNANYHCFGGPDVVGDIDVAFATAITSATLEAAAIAAGM
jgi:Zn-dependent M28 family amino/carboxypeptidase